MNAIFSIYRALGLLTLTLVLLCFNKPQSHSLDEFWVIDEDKRSRHDQGSGLIGTVRQMTDRRACFKTGKNNETHISTK